MTEKETPEKLPQNNKDVSVCIYAQSTVYFFSTGEEFSKAASVLLGSEHYDAENGRLVQPVSMLIGQSLESYLKAYLSLQEISKQELQKKFGHDLASLLEAAKKFEMSPLGQLEELVSLFVDGHSSATNYAFRYLNPSHTYKTFDKTQLRKALDILRHDMRKAIKPEDALQKLGGRH